MDFTENGAAVEEVLENGRVQDPQRQQFLQDHFAQAARAVSDGVPLHGYFVWSLLDNFAAQKQGKSIDDKRTSILLHKRSLQG